MSWYTTAEEAEKARVKKEAKFKIPFIVVKDSEQEGMYWAQRKELYDK